MTATIDGLTCRTAVQADNDRIDEVHDAAFGAEHGIPALLELLRASWAWIDDGGFVAELDEQIVGHVQYTSAIVDAPQRLVDVLVLSPVGVVPEHHGKGIGSTLIRHSLGVIEQRPEPVVFLEGNPAYYSRFGWVAGDGLDFHRPSIRTPKPAFQARKQPSYDDALSGRLVYPDAFWKADAVGLR